MGVQLSPSPPFMKKQTQYYITYELDEKGGYIASAPAIPGCAVYGKTVREAYRNVLSAIQECLEVIQEFKKAPPRETLRPETVRKLSFVEFREYAKT